MRQSVIKLSGLILMAVSFGLLDSPVPAADLSAVALAKAETWRLDDQGQWQQTAGSKDEEFLLRVAQVKKLVDMGQPQKVREAAKQLKTDFPDIAGADFNSFIEAEVLLAQGKLTKAIRQYDKFLDDYPASPLRDAALEREFAIASDYLAGRKKQVLLVLRLSGFDEGVKIMEKISDRTGIADIAKRALITVAQSYEKRHKYNEAYLKWSEVSSRWPTGQTGKDALLAMARTKYSSFRGPEYDGAGLISAKSYYENFRLRYPEDARQIQTDEILSRISEQMAEKQLGIAKYYERTGSIEPANMYYQMVVDNWPQSKAAETAKEKISKK
jgi:outer membrane protein assembly factor BamD (BamD/ComL family)